MAAPRNERYPNLDGIRGLAIALVFAHHLPPDIAGSTFTRNGRYGVTLFFVLSGFLIASRLFGEAERRGTVASGRFLVRRIARIGPAYFAVLALYVLAVAVLGMFEPANRELFLDKLPTLLSFASNWHPSATEGPFFVAWSLGVEVQFYLALALVAWLGGVRWLPGVAATVLLVRVGATLAAAPGEQPSLLRGIEESIWLGVLTAAFARTRTGAALLARTRSPWPGAVLLVAFLAVLATVELPHKHGLDSLALAALAATAIAACAHGPALPLVSGRLASYLGERSYGLYLCHMLAILAARIALASPWSVALAVALAIASAELLYRGIERPGAAWVNRALTPRGVRDRWIARSLES